MVMILVNGRPSVGRSMPMGGERESVVVYGTAWCPDCVRAKHVLDRSNIPYVWIDIQEDPEATRRVMELNNGMRSVPTIVFPDGRVLVEPSNSELAAMLKKDV
jgi:mycoredoxin